MGRLLALITVPGGFVLPPKQGRPLRLSYLPDFSSGNVKQKLAVYMNGNELPVYCMLCHVESQLTCAVSIQASIPPEYLMPCYERTRQDSVEGDLRLHVMVMFLVIGLVLFTM